MKKALNIVGAFFALIIAFVIYEIAIPSSSCSEGLLCNNTGWNGHTAIALVVILALIGLAVWGILASFRKTKN